MPHKRPNIYVDAPPSHPTSLGDVWVGTTRPNLVVLEQEALTQGLDELQQLRAMKRRLLEWADQLEDHREPGDVGPFIARELRNRMDSK